jgi:hypothetical protein
MQRRHSLMRVFPETTSLLQSAYSDYQIGPFENLHQPVKNTPLIVLGARLKVFFQYSLRLADRLKSQLMISHCFLPLKKWLTGEADREIKSAFRLSHQFLFRCGAILCGRLRSQARNVGHSRRAGKGTGRRTDAKEAARLAAPLPRRILERELLRHAFDCKAAAGRLL